MARTIAQIRAASKKRHASARAASQPATKAYVKRAIKSVREVNEKLIDNSAGDSVAYDLPDPVLKLTDTDATAGDKITPKRISFRGFVRGNDASVAAQVRLLVVQWFTDDNLDVPALSDILEYTAAEDQIHAPYKFTGSDNSVNFKVLIDRTYVVGTTSSSEGMEKKMFNFTIYPKRLQRKHILMTGSNVGKNNVYMFLTSDFSSAGSEPTYSGLGVHEYYTEA